MTRGRKPIHHNVMVGFRFISRDAGCGWPSTAITQGRSMDVAWYDVEHPLEVLGRDVKIHPLARALKRVGVCCLICCLVLLVACFTFRFLFVFGTAATKYGVGITNCHQEQKRAGDRSCENACTTTKGH